jgi:hypothetical protein
MNNKRKMKKKIKFLCKNPGRPQMGEELVLGCGELICYIGLFKWEQSDWKIMFH